MKTTLLLMMSGNLLVAALLTGCSGGTKQLSASSAVPAAQGSAKFSKTKNENTSIDLKVEHLADPTRLSPPASHYVVWTRRDSGGPAQNVGALSVDKHLTGTLKTVTSLHQFELFITAEQSGQIQQPTGTTLLWTEFKR